MRAFAVALLAALLSAGAAAAQPPQTAQPQVGPIEFVRDLVQTDDSDAMIARVGAGKATDPKVKRFAAQMTAAIGSEAAAARKFAGSSAIQLRPGLSAEAEQEGVRLASQKGAGFDRAFLGWMAPELTKEQALYRNEAARKQNAFSSLAARAAARVSAELQQAKSLQR